MRICVAVLFAVLLLSVSAFAEVAASVAYEQDGFFIQRILQTTKQSRVSITTDTAITAVTSEVKLYIKNAGSIDRSGVMIAEDLSYLPSGAKIEFLQKPSDIDGRRAAWALVGLGAGEDYSVSYRVPLEVNAAAFKLLASPQITAKMVDVSVVAPASVEKGRQVDIALLAAGNRPVSGAKIIVGAPSGANMQVSTDESGKARFQADEAGFYTYSVIGYNLLSISATESVAPKLEAPGALAAIPPKPLGFLDAVGGILPYVAGIVLAIAIGLMAFNYVQATSESKPAPSQPQSPPSTYSGADQTFSYTYAQGTSTKSGVQGTAPAAAPSQDDEQKRREATRALLERRMAEMPPKPDAEADLDGDEAVEFTPSKSRSEDIEKTIKELEALKSKLKKKKARGRK